MRSWTGAPSLDLLAEELRHSKLSRGPLRMAGKEPSQKSELVDEERTKTKARHPGRGSEKLTEFGKPISTQGKRNGDCNGHAHHPDHSSCSEYQQIHGCPDRIVNR